MKILRILIDDKLPYLFTILLAIVAYQIDHFINYNLETPIIQYDYSTLSKKDSANLSVEHLQVKITNLNKKISFKNLIFNIKYSSKVNCKPCYVGEADLIPVSPAPILSDSCAYNIESKMVGYKIPQLQPGGTYLATLVVKHNPAVTENPLIYLNSSDSVWLTSSNAETFIINNQVLINIILIMLSFTAIIVYAILVNKYQFDPIVNEKN